MAFIITTRAFSKTISLKLFSSISAQKALSLPPANMITPKRLIKLAKKWQKVAAAKRRRISFPTYSSFVASKGHFVVYTTDEKRFIFPLELLGRNVFVELFRLSEEEFGLPADGPITLPCDSAFIEYIIELVQGCVDEDVEKALLVSLTTCHGSASSSSALEHNSHQQRLICGF